MISFLILPMQRVTRLPLLLDVGLPLLLGPHHSTSLSTGGGCRLYCKPVLVLVTDDMPENKGQNGRVLCSRVGAARHEQGRVGDGTKIKRSPL